MQFQTSRTAKFAKTLVEAQSLSCAVQSEESFGAVRGCPGCSLLILCDHATNLLPPEYGTLGLPPEEFDRHIAYDIGALPVAVELGRRLGATVVYSKFSRLLIDPNRATDDPTLIMQLSDGAVIPGNVNLGAAEISKRIETHYQPYHDAIASELDSIRAAGLTPAIISIHSFTERWRGALREWRAGILWDKDPRLAAPLLQELRTRTGAAVGDNQPYTGKLRGDTLYRHATLAGLPNVLIEIRQDLIRDEAGQSDWADILSQSLTALFADKGTAAALSRVDYFGSHTDIDGEKR